MSDELVVYDLEHHRVHRLNRTAALVWKRCDGKTAVTDIAASLERELSVPASEELVRQALELLQQALLLEDAPRLSRREFGQRVGLSGAWLALVPMVTSLVAPAAAQARSSNGNPREHPKGLRMLRGRHEKRGRRRRRRGKPRQ